MKENISTNYKKLFENLACGVYSSSKEGKFLDANPAMLKMLGYESLDSFLKVDIQDIYLVPDKRRTFQEIIDREGYVANYEADLICKDGNIISVLITSSGRFDQDGKITGYEGIVIDQSKKKQKEKELKKAHDYLQGKVIGYEGIIANQYQHKQMEKELKKAHDLLNKVIQSSPNMIVVTDLNGNIILMNRVAEKILGCKVDGVVSRANIENYYPEGMAEEVMEMVRGPEYGGKGKLISYPVVNINRDGEAVEGNLAAAILYDANGNETACVQIFVDFTERLLMERKLRQIEKQLLQSEKLAAMGRLTSQIAHELNNPLYGIMNTMELLKTEISPESKRRKILDMALSETVRLSDLLRKMLSLSKPDQKERKPVDINEILDEILLLHEKQLQERNIRISSTFAPGLGKVYASKDQLRQVFLNMISNSRDAMPEGGTFSVKTKPGKDNMYIEISDTGTGVKEERLGKIFDAFYTTKDSVKGVGLGLSVCYGIIREHGGEIKVESKLGSGTTFIITLPVYRDAAVKR
ncbi:MAG: PAS domain S-box protein [Deltaproteobacteria bacterium]|nr:PAS domain S-box protein [Deltaproteobacteria bacterium]